MSPVTDDLPRRFRITQRADYVRIQGQGLELHTRHLHARCLLNQREHSRFGWVVSRRVGNAVVRNKAKRQLREALRRQKNNLLGWDVVFIARPKTSTSSYHELFNEIQQILQTLTRRTKTL